MLFLVCFACVVMLSSPALCRTSSRTSCRNRHASAPSVISRVRSNSRRTPLRDVITARLTPFLENVFGYLGIEYVSDAVFRSCMCCVFVCVVRVYLCLCFFTSVLHARVRCVFIMLHVCAALYNPMKFCMSFCLFQMVCKSALFMCS